MPDLRGWRRYEPFFHTVPGPAPYTGARPGLCLGIPGPHGPSPYCVPGLCGALDTLDLIPVLPEDEKAGPEYQM